MKVIRYPQHISLNQSTCVTVGNFDGVHVGHQALISEVVSKAKVADVPSVVVTMQPLPIQFFNHTDAVEILTSFKLKYRLLRAIGVDFMCVLNFNQKLASMSASDFYQKIIIDGLRAESVVVGDDFKFGAGRLGDVNVMRELSADTGISVKEFSAINLGPKRISSTAIRHALASGDLKTAEAMLGRHFNVLGRVAHGKKLGRELGYPTINLELNQGAFSLHGIYAASIIIAGKSHFAVASVGYNPSVGGNAKRIEVHVLDFDQDIYGQSVEVLFYKKLRNEVEFDSLTALISAIEQDVVDAKEFFANR